MADGNLLEKSELQTANAAGDFAFGIKADSSAYWRRALTAAESSFASGSDATHLAPKDADAGTIYVGKLSAPLAGVFVNKLTQSTSTAAPASLTEYPNANEWGIHRDTNADTVSLAYNKGGTLVLLDLENAGGGITGWSAGAGNALVPDVAGAHDIGLTGTRVGTIYTTAVKCSQNIEVGYQRGFYSTGSRTFLSCVGQSQIAIANGGVQLPRDDPFGWSSSGDPVYYRDLALHRDGAGILAQRNGTNPQEWRLYNTYTDASNHEYLETKFLNNNAYLFTRANGTGSFRDFYIGKGGGAYISFDSTTTRFFTSPTCRSDQPGNYDLGSAGVPWRNIYLRPSSSLTPSANGDLVIEATNNTTLTFKLKGSDGTVRSGTVALA